MGRGPHHAVHDHGPLCVPFFTQMYFPFCSAAPYVDIFKVLICGVIAGLFWSVYLGLFRLRNYSRREVSNINLEGPSHFVCEQKQVVPVCRVLLDICLAEQF